MKSSNDPQDNMEIDIPFSQRQRISIEMKTIETDEATLTDVDDTKTGGQPGGVERKKTLQQLAFENLTFRDPSSWIKDPDDHFYSKYNFENRSPFDRIREGLRAFLRKIHYIFEVPDSSRLSRFVGMMTMLLIVASTLSIVLETFPLFYSRDPMLWYVLEASFVLIFTIEVFLRYISSTHYVLFFFDIVNSLDVISILPFYLELLFNQDVFVHLRIIRIFRILRIFRIFKVSRYIRGIKILYATVKGSKDILLLGLVILTIFTFSCSSVVYYFERGDWDPIRETWYICVNEPIINGTTRYVIREETRCISSSFQSILHSMWWSVNTLSTVGQGGNAFPRTIYGKIVAIICQVMGVIAIALPTSLIGANFHEALESDREQTIMLQRRRKQFQSRLLCKVVIKSAEDDIRKIVMVSQKATVQDLLKEILQLYGVSIPQASDVLSDQGNHIELYERLSYFSNDEFVCHFIIKLPLEDHTSV